MNGTRIKIKKSEWNRIWDVVREKGLSSGKHRSEAARKVGRGPGCCVHFIEILKSGVELVETASPSGRWTYSVWWKSTEEFTAMEALLDEAEIHAK